MKKIYILTFIAIFLASVSIGCKKNDSSNESTNNSKNEQSSDSKGKSDVIEITEKMFTEQVNDVYLNAEDYLGKTITYEGIFDIDYGPYTNNSYYYVIRYGPGCCGDDGYVGFEVQWDGEYPEQDDWVEVTGVLEVYEEGGYKYLYLKVTSINVLETRGLEFVS